MINNKLLKLISEYKLKIRHSELKDERYKWEFLKTFQGRPDVNAENFTEEIKSIKFQNLLYAMSIAVINNIAREKPEELRKLFSELFDENLQLNNRILSFNQKTLELYRSFGGELSHHQDERSIATYLTLYNPNKYTFYKSSFYVEYCKLLDIKPAGKNEKYIHYLSLIDQFINSYIVNDTELISLVKSYLPDLYDGENHLLLAQDILYSMLNKSNEESSFWVFQGNSKIYDIQKALQDNAIKTWSVKSHKDSIKIGDRFILWSTGKDSGCYALGKIVSDVFESEDNKEEQAYYFEKSETEIKPRVEIEITHNFGINPILKKQILENSIFKNFKGGNQGTNFTSDEEEYNEFLRLSKVSNVRYWKFAPGENASLWNEFHSQDLLRISFNQLDEDAISISSNKLELIENLNLTASSKTLQNINNFIFEAKVGDVVFANKGRTTVVGVGLITGEYKLNSSFEEYRHTRSIKWIADKEWGYIPNSIDRYPVLFAIDTFSETPNGEWILNEYLKAHPEYKHHFTLNHEMKPNHEIIIPLNQILYGPPGTGKTFTLNNEYFPKYISTIDSITEEQFIEDLLRKCSWWQVIAVVLFELKKAKVTEISDHPWILQKVKFSNSNTIRSTIWGQLQSHTIESCPYVNVKSKQGPFIFNKTEDSYWEIVDVNLQDEAPEIIDLYGQLTNYKATISTQINRFVFTTFHQSFGYEDFIEGIKPVLSEEDSIGEVGYRIEDGIFKELCKRAKNDPNSRYAIFIDEINRGNISAIFGELITLIETDKRAGMKNEISLTLPYSKESFSVPQNVDIYGTMNTADRSVEALDTALRRRFSFVEMLPDPYLLKGVKLNDSDIDLSKLLTAINERIEILVDRDHTIGHAFFMGVKSLDDLREVFKNKIIPLLQEYFYGDYHKMELIIGEEFFNKPKINSIKFAVRTDSIDREGVVYHLKDISDKSIISDEQFNEMLQKVISGVE
jgi:hypothetical protein